MMIYDSKADAQKAADEIFANHQAVADFEGRLHASGVILGYVKGYIDPSPARGTSAYAVPRERDDKAGEWFIRECPDCEPVTQPVRREPYGEAWDMSEEE